MDNKEFIYYRKALGKTQKEMAELAGTSLKAIHSYEQGWRNIPPNVERQILFLFFKKKEKEQKPRPCWKIKKCTPEQKQKCPAWEFGAGKLCWFINGTICEGKARKNWKEKMKICKKCEVFLPMLPH